MMILALILESLNLVYQSLHWRRLGGATIVGLNEKKLTWIRMPTIILAHHGKELMRFYSNIPSTNRLKR